MTISPEVAENPLFDLWGIGWFVAQWDKALRDLGLSALGAQTVEFLMLGIGLFLALSVLLGRTLPWLSTVLHAPASDAVGVVPAVLLAPEWLVTRAITKMGRAPGRLVYGYGEAVLVLADVIRAAVSALLRTIAKAGHLRHPLAGALLVVGFLSWNSGSCVGGTEPCVSPVQYWTQQVEVASAES